MGFSAVAAIVGILRAYPYDVAGVNPRIDARA